MFTANLRVLSYHKFGDAYDGYQFSRTYSELQRDLSKIIFDWVTIDDARESQIQACNLMAMRNIRAKLFVCTGLVGDEGYCTWDQLRQLAKNHDIESHSGQHLKHTKMTVQTAVAFMENSMGIIEHEIGRRPRYFVPPFNTYDELIERQAARMGMQLVKNRITILNNTAVSDSGVLSNVIIGNGPVVDKFF